MDLLGLDPKNLGLLSLGLRLMSTPGKFGQALGTSGLGALQDMQTAQDRQSRQKQAEAAQRMQALQEQSMLLQLTQAQEAQRKRQAVEQAYMGAIQSPAQQALAGGGGPTAQNAQAMQGLKPRLDQSKLIENLMMADPMMAAQMLQPKPADYKVVGDALLEVGPQGAREVYRKPKDTDWNDLIVIGPDGKPQLNTLLLDAKKSIANAGKSTTSVSYGAPIAAINPKTGAVELVRPDSKGGMQFTGVQPPAKEKPAMTEAQAKAATFKSQMEAAEKELATIPVDMSKLGNQVDVGLAGGITNLAASPIAQRARQAQEQWAESFLRFKTGAAATKDEVILNVRTFFPQPGDSKQVIEQKQRMRAQAAQDISFAAGQSAGQATADNDPLGLRK